MSSIVVIRVGIKINGKWHYRRYRNLDYMMIVELTRIMACDIAVREKMRIVEGIPFNAFAYAENITFKVEK